MYGRTIFSCLSDSAAVAYTKGGIYDFPRDAIFVKLKNGHLWIDLGNGKRMRAEDWEDAAAKVMDLRAAVGEENLDRDEELREAFASLSEVPGTSSGSSDRP